MTIAYSKRSKPSAVRLAEVSDDVTIIRASQPAVDVNWGRASANTSLNPDISNATNKRIMRSLFQTHDVRMPQLLSTQQAREKVLDGKTVIGRPDRHTGGRGYWKITTTSQLSRALQGTRRKKAATHFMEFVESDREYRVHVFKGRSIRISEKRFGTSGETSHGCYTTVKPNPEHRIKHVRSAAKKALEATGLDFGAVDVLATNDDCWVLEVNAAPGIGGTLPKLYADTFKRYLNGDW